ncbi:MAG: hypothetical protein AABX94_00560 [Nanoarchaeota archaeon]
MNFKWKLFILLISVFCFTAFAVLGQGVDITQSGDESAEGGNYTYIGTIESSNKDIPKYSENELKVYRNYVISFIISLVLGIFIIYYLIRKNFIWINVIIHGLMFLVSLLLLIGFTNNLWVRIVSLASLLFSFIIIRNLVWKKERSKVYSVNMSTGAIIIGALTLSINSFFFLWFSLADLFNPLFILSLLFGPINIYGGTSFESRLMDYIFMGRFVLYTLFGIIGLIIDKKLKDKKSV